MKKVVITGAALLLAAASVQAQEVFDDRWYIGGTLGASVIDEDRLADESWPYYGVYFGKFFSPNFSVDVRLDKYEGDFDDNDITIPAGVNPSIELYSLGLVGRYHFGDNDDWRPYGLAAVGIQQHDNFLDDGRDIYASLGFGANAYMTDHWKLGAELEARYDNDRATFDNDNGFLDFIISMNLSYAFGERPRPAVAVAPEPPPPAVQPPPRPAPPPPPEPEVLFEFDAEVTFAFDSDEIRPSAEPELNRAAAILSERTEIILVEVAGHTDSTGPEAYNQNLSERRAQSVADYLAARGVERERMRVQGFGETQPKVANDTRENRQMNRRVVITILERSSR